jgi:signal transduction histidine kinase
MGGTPVAAPNTQLIRFRSELESDRGSWVTVLLTYSFGALILFVLFRFTVGFQQFGDALERAGILAQEHAAMEQLLRDLDPADSGLETASALERFDKRYTRLETTDGVPGLDADIPDAAAELEKLRLEGAARDRIRLFASELADAHEFAARIASQRAQELGVTVKVWAALLGVAVIVGVFGAGFLFLKRSRHLEGLLSRRAAELTEVDSSRRLFFAKASHELRTPVTAIRGEAEVALTDADDLETVRVALQHISAQAKFLDHRIEEMIGIARASDGKLHLDAARLDLREIVSCAVEDARSFAASVEVALDLTLPDKPLEISGDALWLKRALLAVIENALKFSPMEGRVEVVLAERDGAAEATVRDEGPGVMPEELPLIFDAYYQTDAGKARGGSGLGLAMTRWVAEQHGGRAYARNVGSWRLPQGCAVTVAVKLEHAA